MDYKGEDTATADAGGSSLPEASFEGVMAGQFQIPHSSNTLVEWDTVNREVGPVDYDSTTGRLEILSGGEGLYQISCSVTFFPNATGDREYQLFIQRSGTDFDVYPLFLASTGANFPTVCAGSYTARVQAGSYVYLTANQYSGAAMDLYTATPAFRLNYLTVVRLAP